MLKTIGVGGQLSNGKDVLSDYLAIRLNELCNEKWSRNAFANKVKETFESAFDKDRDFIEKWKRIDDCPEGFTKNVRQCLIGIGDGFRQMHPNIWIEKAFREQKENQVISDCRYINECHFIREHGGLTVLLWREGFMNSMPNASEQEFMPFIKKCLETQSWGTGDDRWKLFEGEVGYGMSMPFDFFIRNEGTVDDLKKKVDDMLIPFIKRKWTDMFK